VVAMDITIAKPLSLWRKVSKRNPNVKLAPTLGFSILPYHLTIREVIGKLSSAKIAETRSNCGCRRLTALIRLIRIDLPAAAARTLRSDGGDPWRWRWRCVSTTMALLWY
jgi:hypothetical protein